MNATNNSITLTDFPSNTGTIILNAGPGPTVPLFASAGGFYVDPVRAAAGGSLNVLVYNPGSKEIYEATGKTFVIQHPEHENKYLVHACLEGPEAGVYYRGTCRITEKFVTVELPSYVDKLSTDFTVQVTGIVDDSDPEVKVYSATRVKSNSFKVYGPPGEFSWHVHGKRLSIETEPLKTEKTLHSFGPYSYLN